MTHPLPHYILYIRRRDRAMRLVRCETGKRITIRQVNFIPGGKKIEGVFVLTAQSTGVFLMDDEICVVEEFPFRVQIRARGV